jgi:hypothetical protein
MVNLSIHRAAPCSYVPGFAALYAIRIREFEHGNEGSFDDIISRFAYHFEKPRNVQDDEGDTGY